jgi:hypothetical protein
MKKEIYIGIGIVALFIYLKYQHEKEKASKKISGGGMVQPAPIMYWGVPFQYGGGGDVNQNVNVYQTQAPMSTPIQQPIAQPSPALMGGRGGGRGK